MTTVDLTDDADVHPDTCLCDACLFFEPCSFCHRPAEGNHAIHRDGYLVGPVVPLCDACGGNDEPTLGEIWQKIAWRRWSAHALAVVVRVRKGKLVDEAKTFTVYAKTRDDALARFATLTEAIDEATVAEDTGPWWTSEEDIIENRVAPGAT